MKQVPAVRVDSSITIPTKNSRTLTLLRGEASTLPDLPPPPPPPPYVEPHEPTPEEIAQRIWQHRHNFNLGATIHASHLGNGTSFKLDTKYPYLPEPFTGNQILAGAFPADGIVPDLDCIDTPRDPVAGLTRIEVDETFRTYLMFRPPGISSRYVPLRKAVWKWGGVASSANNWNPIIDPKSTDSEQSGAECMEHPEWTENSKTEELVEDQ